MTTGNDQQVIARLLKIQALAKRGVGGEKENAQRMLVKLLAKHGLTVDDLTNPDDQKVRTRLAYKTSTDKMLAMQLIAVLQKTLEPEVYRVRGKRILEVDLTAAQGAELQLQFDVHRRSLAAELRKAARATQRAYLHVNQLYPETDEPSKGPRISAAELSALMRAAQGMQATEVRKAITP